MVRFAEAASSFRQLIIGLAIVVLAGYKRWPGCRRLRQLGETKSPEEDVLAEESLVGKDLDGWCNPCGLMLAHVVIALKNDKPYRVQCKTCEHKHVHRAAKPGTKKPRAKKPPKPTEYELIMAKRDADTAVAYSAKDDYDPDQLISHPTLGVGLVTNRKGPGKMEVLFAGGQKLLLCNR